MPTKWWKWPILLIASSLVLALGPLTPVHADGHGATTTLVRPPTQTIQAKRLKPAWVHLLRPYVHRYGVTWHFKKRVPAKIVRKVGKARVRKLKRYWANVAHHRYPTTAPLAASSVPGMNPGMNWVGKHGSIALKWFGLRIWMDAYMSRLVLNGLLTAATILALLKGPYSRVIALSLYFYYAGLWACRNSRTKTTTVYLLAIPPFAGVPGLLFCNPFR